MGSAGDIIEVRHLRWQATLESTNNTPMQPGRYPDEALEAALYDTDPVVRDEARGWVAQHADPDLIASLVALLDAQHRMTRRRAARVLSEIRPERARPALVDALSARNRAPRLRAGAARILTVLAADIEPALAAGLRDADPRVRAACATPAAPMSSLFTALGDEEGRVVERAATAIEVRAARATADQTPVPTDAVRSAAERTGSSVVWRLLARLDPDSDALVTAARGGDPAALDFLAHETTLTELLDGPNRVSAAWALSRGGSVPSALATDDDPRVRAAAAKVMHPGDPALPALLSDDDPGVRWTAKRARLGLYEPAILEDRLGPHAFSDAASATPPYGLKPDDAVADVARPHAALALCHTRFDVNLGVAVRSAEAAGLREVFVVGRKDLFKSPARGTDLLLPLRHAPDAAALVRMAREADYQIVAVQQTPRSVPYHQADYPPRPLFVLGTEDDGIPGNLRVAADIVVEIPMYGVIDSLNVAAAATCVMFHWRTFTESRSSGRRPAR